jgi:hypothetical protein
MVVVGTLEFHTSDAARQSKKRMTKIPVSLERIGYCFRENEQAPVD